MTLFLSYTSDVIYALRKVSRLVVTKNESDLSDLEYTDKCRRCCHFVAVPEDHRVGLVFLSLFLCTLTGSLFYILHHHILVWICGFIVVLFYVYIKCIVFGTCRRYYAEVDSVLQELETNYEKNLVDLGSQYLHDFGMIPDLAKMTLDYL